MIKKLSLFSTEKNLSNIQVFIILILVLNLIISNIIVIKPINLFGLDFLPNTAAILTFPITYILSDLLQEVYGYKITRIAANYAILGTAMTSIYFAITINLNGNESWNNQEALISILGFAPIIALASIIAFWVGDYVNDRVFRIIKKLNPSSKYFFIRSIVSSLAGKYVDAIIFTFIGLHFLPLHVQIMIIINAPFIQILLEIALFPLTNFLTKKLKKAENIQKEIL